MIVNEAEVAKKNAFMYLWAAWISQMKHFLLSEFHLKAVAMLVAVAMSIAVLFFTLWMMYCENLRLNAKILLCS